MKTMYPFLDIDIEIPKNKLDVVDAVRTWISVQTHLPKFNDETIMLFLHSCYYSLDRTKDTIEKYHALRAKCPEFFSNWDHESMVDMWNVSEMCPLPKHTPDDGYRIILYRLKEYDASKLHINDLVKCFCAFNMVKISEDGLVPGYVVLLDMKGVTFSHFMKVTPYVQSIRNILHYLQECHPVRLKQVHIINTVSFIDRILSFVKPFIHSNLLNILHLHSNLETLTEYFPLDLLPMEYGGKQTNGGILHKEFQTLIEDRYKPYLKECEKYVSTKDNRSTKSNKKATAVKKMQGSFKKLELD